MSTGQGRGLVRQQLFICEVHIMMVVTVMVIGQSKGGDYRSPQPCTSINNFISQCEVHISMVVTAMVIGQSKGGDSIDHHNLVLQSTTSSYTVKYTLAWW